MLRNILLILTLIFSLSQAKEFKSLSFTLKDIYGKTLEVKGVKSGLEVKGAKGKVVLVEFWGTHCPPCLFSINHYIKLKNKYKDKLEMLAIEVQDTPNETLKEFVKSKGINYRVFSQIDNLDFVRYLGARSGWQGAIPYLMVFDTNGNFVTSAKGMVNATSLDIFVEKILENDKKSIQPNSTQDKNITTAKTEDNSTK